MTRRNTLLVVVTVVGTLVVVALGALAVTAFTGSESSASTTTTVTTDETADTSNATAIAPEQRCVDLWNSPENDDVPVTDGGTLDPRNAAIVWGPYVSVGFAADYPDLCLITLSDPDSNVAFQFLEQSYPHSGFALVGGNLTRPAYLDPSVTNWNADTNPEDGTIVLR